MAERTLMLVKETNFGQSDWYKVMLDDEYIMGSYNLERVKDMYNEIKENKGSIKPKIEILVSEKI
jgi:hypothetical protein